MSDPFDACACGDYRHQHLGPEGQGACEVCARSHQPWDPCSRFRFSAADPGPEHASPGYIEAIRATWGGAP